MRVGGRDFDYTKEQVEEAMGGETPELIQKHVVEMIGTIFPPKQVLATVTGWPRQSFTTMEAQRVLTRIGFKCRRADQGAWVEDTGEGVDPEGASLLDRIEALEAALATAQTAIAGLAARVNALEVRQ